MSDDQEEWGSRWWEEPGDLAQPVFRAVELIEDSETNRRQEILHHIRLYGNREFLGLGPTSTEQWLLPFFTEERNLRYNAVKSVIDTMTSRIGRNRPKASFLTQGGDFTLQRQAKRLEKYVEGNFYETDLYRKGRSVFRDGCIVGTGIFKFFPKQSMDGTWKVWNERVFPWEIRVDQFDSMHGDPRMLFHVKDVDKDLLFRKYTRPGQKFFKKGPLLREILDEADKGDENDAGKNTLARQAKTVEAWHLPSGPGAKDGKHVIAVSSGELFVEPWNEDWFPYVFWHWSKPVVGFWGTGIARDINGVQIEINRLLDKIQRAYQLFANPWVSVRRGSRVVKSHISNEIGRILEHDGDPPQVHTHQPIHPQIFAHLQQLKNDAFDLPGVGDAAAQNRKPPDLESGEALRRWNDIVEGRHGDQGLDWEQVYMDAAKVVIGISRRMHKGGTDPQVMAHHRRRSRRWIEPIKWSQVNIAESSYVMKIYPTSLLPTTPAGRTATVQEWLRSNLVDKTEARFLLEFPDLEEFQAMELVDHELMLDAIEAILDEDPPRLIAPEPYQNIELALSLMQSAYLRAKLDKAPEDRLELMRRYVSSVKRLRDIRDGKFEAAQQPGQIAQAPPEPTALGVQPPTQELGGNGAAAGAQGLLAALGGG